MAVHHERWRRGNQWIVKWRDPWTGKRRSRGFPDEEAAGQFDNAQALMAAHEKELVRRARQQRAARYRITVGELLDRYIRQLQAEVTRKTSRYHVQSLLDIYGGRQAGRMTNADVAAWVEILRGRGVADSTIVRRASILRGGLRWGVREGLLESNPIPDLRLPKARSKRVPPPTPAEARRIMEHAAPHIQRVIILGTATGARIGPSELFRITWADVDTERATVRIHTADKGARHPYRDVPLRPDVLTLLRVWQAHDTQSHGSPYVINYKGDAVRSINSGWHAALRRAGVRDEITPYALRHYFATEALARGAEFGSVAAIMAHRPSMLFDVYQHVTHAQKVAAIKPLPSLLKKGQIAGL